MEVTESVITVSLFCFKGVTVAEEVTVMDMEEDTAEDFGVEVTLAHNPKLVFIVLKKC